MAKRPAIIDRVDWVLCAVLFTGTAVYLSSLPHNLGGADEAWFLYEAKRIRDGEMMYRDFFEFVAPGAWYVLAFLYWLFGTTMTTARVALAAVHGLTVVALFASCRIIGVRRSLSVLVPFAFVALCQPAWPYASPHWFSTSLVAIMLLLALRAAVVPGARPAFVLGVVAGLLMCVQQQKGVVMAAGVTLFLVADSALARASLPSLRAIVTDLALLAAGFLLVTLPVFGSVVAAAGWRCVYRGLVVFPASEYPAPAPGLPWAGIPPLTESFAPYTWPTLFRFLPLALVPLVLRLAFADPNDRSRRRIVATLTIFCFFAGLSVWYFRDFIHVAFVAALAFVALAESVEWALRVVSQPRLTAAAGGFAAAAVAVALGYQLYVNTIRLRTTFSIPYETEFGRIDYSLPWEVPLLEAIRAQVKEAPTSEIFCYPGGMVSLYLTAGLRNPTPYQYFPPTEPRFRQVLDILDARQVPLVIMAPFFTSPNDPIRQMMKDRYEVVWGGQMMPNGGWPPIVVFKRKYVS